jgi:hypothetical protein
MSNVAPVDDPIGGKEWPVHEREFMYEIDMPLTGTPSVIKVYHSLHLVETEHFSGLPLEISRCPVALLTRARLQVSSPPQALAMGSCVNSWHVDQRLVATGLNGATPTIRG